MSTTRVPDTTPEDNTAEQKEETKDEKKEVLVIHKTEQNQFDEQSTSSGINANQSPILTQISLVNSRRSGSLSSLDVLAEQLLRTKTEVEDDDSFVTVESSKKDITTSTDPAIIFSVNERTQNILTARNEPTNYPPPPPYDYNPGPRYQGNVGQTPVYQERYAGQTPSGPQDASRTPPYQRNYLRGSVYDDVVDAFISKEIRNKFVQRVYTILALQLLLTFGFVALCLFEEHVKKFVLTHRVLSYVAIGVFTVLILVLFCYEQTRKIFPVNFILLLLVTMSMAYMTAAISCIFETYIVLATFGVSTSVVIIISIVACQRWFDVTECGMVLCLGTFIVMAYGMIAMFVTVFTGSNITFLIYACLMTLLFCMYLMYDTQQILGGRRIELSPEEYILGALTLYIDFIMIFQNLLYIFGALSANG